MKQIIKTDNAPAPIGPYNQAVFAGNLLFISGQVALDANTGELHTATIEVETKKVMENIKAILETAGLTFNNIVKTSIFLSDMDSFTKVNEVYGGYFTSDFPARETIAVKTLPKHANVEISVTAYKP